MLLFFRVGLLGMAAFAAARDDAALEPGEASPEFVTVTKVDTEKGLLVYRYHHMIPVHQEYFREEGGKHVKHTIVRHICEQVEVTIAIKEARLYDAKGRRVAARGWERLAAGTTILKSADGNKVHPRYLRAVRDDILILVLPTREPEIIGEVILPTK